MCAKAKGIKKLKIKSSFPVINPDAGGIDVGNSEISVAIDPSKCEDYVQTFGTFTDDYLDVVNFLKSHHITTVAMECTGVYWVQLFVILERNGIECVVANARYIKNVSGRKDDENDAMWIQRLHSCGLIKGSFQLDGSTRELRDLMRSRKKIIQDQNRCTNRLIKSLVLMNIKVQNVISDIDGKTGRAILQAIVDGERDARKLTELADPRIKASNDEIVKSLRADWNDNYLHILKLNYHHYLYLLDMIVQLDLQIEKQLKVIVEELSASQEVKVDLALERKRSTDKNRPHFNVTAYLAAILGTDLTQLTGINELSALAFFSEVGRDMSKFNSASHLKSWLNIVPVTEVTGGKIQKEKMKKRYHHAGQVLRIAANTVRRSNSPFGNIFRKNLARGGPSKAILSVADKMATSIYHMILKREPFDPSRFESSQRDALQKKIHQLEKKLQKLKITASHEVVI